MKPEDSTAIRELGLFRNIRADTFSTLIANGFLQRFPQGVTLIQERETADFLHIVVEGLIELYATSLDRETTLSLVPPIGVFILAAVLNDKVYLQSARTLKKSRILMIPAENVRSAMSSDPTFMRAIVLELAREYRDAIKDLKNQKMRTTTMRLANWLICNRRPEGLIELSFGKQILASRLGMTPEILSRNLSMLKKYGVEVQGSRIEITRPDDLRQFASPDPLIDDPET